MQVKIFFLFFFCCSFRKAWLLVLQTLLCFAHDTVRMDSKHSNFYKKTCVHLWTNISMRIPSFFLFNIGSFFKNYWNLSLHSFPSQIARTFPKPEDHVWKQVLSKYYKNITQALQTKMTNQVSSEGYSETCQTSTTARFAKIINDF